MVHETNTTEIPHVGTYAGHTGHRPQRPLWWKGYRPRVRPLCGSPKVPSGGDHKQTPGGLRKTDEAKAFRRKLLRRPIALRGDTKHFQPNMLGKVVLRYLDGMDEPLINRVQVILRATMGGRSVSSEEDIVTLQLLCQEVGCPYHEELRSTACSVALVVLWMGLHQEKFPLLATTLQAAAGVSGPQKWALILPSSARVSLVTYTAVIAVRYPELDNV